MRVEFRGGPEDGHTEDLDAPLPQTYTFARLAEPLKLRERPEDYAAVKVTRLLYILRDGNYCYAGES
jgi:hypothetical protein